ncbi:DEAD/DEAH box helicase [Myroides odoratus]|uniref:DEAD/DEAH box helicase n=1 Tax=Myroides odoratus TaxID=256 RepID=UPI00333FBEC0
MENNNLILQAFKHQLLDDTIFALTSKLLSRTFPSLSKINVENEELKKAIWLVSILANSDNNIHQRKAQLFTSLLFLNNQENIEILKVCYILFSRLGNLTATKFLNNLYDEVKENPIELKSKYEFGNFLTQELIYEREKKIIESQNKSYLITDFQKDLWQALKEKNEIAISAPTSSGKSFIIKKFLINKLSNKKKYKVLYIVPSRALINQVSEDFISEINSDIHIKTTYVEDNELFEKEIYVLTPERCIKVLSSNLSVDFVFIDEIQGIEDTSGRGQTFEYVFNEISSKYPNAKIVTAGPNIIRPDKTFYEIFERESSSISTKLSPVFQIKLTLKNVEKGIFKIKVQNNENKSQVFNHDFNFDFSKLKSLGEQIAHLVHKVAPDDFNIVYVRDGDLAQKWSRKYAKIKETTRILDYEVQELIDFLKEDIHKKYFLIECLQKGIAYHHGSLPDIVRKEIEVLYINGKIKTLFCTSTLLEGVNLPANNLFTLQPKKNNTPLSKFEFGNLIGRAGRLNSSLFGTLYYLEKSQDKMKASEYLEVEYEKEIEIFSTNAFIDFEIEDLKVPIKDVNKSNKEKTDKARQFCVFLRLKYLKDNNLVEQYLRKKEYSEIQIIEVIEILRKSLSTIKIPYNTLKKNPTIDPLLQNELFELITDSQIEEWVINKTSNYNEYFDAEQVDSMLNKDKPFYWQLVNLVEKLDSIFDLRSEALIKHSKWITARSVCVQAKKWLANLSIGQIIQENIKYQTSEKVNKAYRKNANNLEDINSIINETIKYNSAITTYLLPKYIKILTDILEIILTDKQKEEYKLTLSLATYLELGTQESDVIQLISSGVTRSVAIQLNSVYRKNTSKEYRENNSIWNWLSNKNEIPELKPIYNRYLKRLKIIGQL